MFFGQLGFGGGRVERGGPVKQSGLFLAQVFLSGSVDADYVAIANKQRDHDLEAGFELRLFP
jgi:hypothetical protein